MHSIETGIDTNNNIIVIKQIYAKSVLNQINPKIVKEKQIECLFYQNHTTNIFEPYKCCTKLQ